MSDNGGPTQAPAWVAALEIAHAHLQQAIPHLEAWVEPPIDPAPAARGIERALASIYDAIDGRAEAIDAMQAAREAARQAFASELPAAVRRHLEEARTAIERGEAVGDKTVPAAAAQRIRASRELPGLHQLERPSLVPHLRVAAPVRSAVAPFEPLPAPKTFDELEDHAARARRHIEKHLAAAWGEGRAPEEDAAAPTGEAGFFAHWARECFDELAMLGSQRSPLLGDDWRHTREIEERMLWTLDAFAALGAPALERIETLVLDAPAPDPERLFAAALMLGSVAGRDSLGMAERLARSFGRDPYALSRFGDALRFVPHPKLGDVLASWLDDGDPLYREVAARVLIARGWLDADALERIAADRPEIAAHALVPLAVLDRAAEQIERALQSDHGGLRRAGWIALALSSRPRALERMRTELGGKHADEVAVVLAVIGSRADAERLRERALRHPCRATIAPLALAGSVPAIEGLIGLLRHKDREIALQAGRTLERITAAGLFADVSIDPQKLAAPDIPEPNSGGFDAPALATVVSDGRDAPAEGSSDTLELPSPEYAHWFAWWRENASRFDRDTRYRRGLPFTALSAWNELDGALLTHEERREVATELLLLSRQHVGFEPDAFVVQQVGALERWRTLLRGRKFHEGG